MTRVFISEYLCSGAWPEDELDASLAREGRAMLLALLEDAARVPGWTICTTWDRRLGSFPLTNVEARPVENPQEEEGIFEELSRSADGVYVIAPELDDQLAVRCWRVLECGGRSLNSSLTAIEACSDKLATHERLQRGGVPTIPTRVLTGDDEGFNQLPVVVKPRFGAGSHETYLFEDIQQFRDRAQQTNRASQLRQSVVQPYIAGRAFSVAAIVREGGESVEIWPVAEQRLSADGRFRYLGGRMPACDVPAAAMIALAEQTVLVLPGLRGYVGLDIILPDGSPERPIIVEVNPRLTTSYLGYRPLSRNNLAPLVLPIDEPGERAEWQDSRVAFDAAGALVSE